MFCKWCGNDINPTDKNCAFCGRETPPMSNCGGFYNLKHGSVASVAVPKMEEKVSVVAPQCTVVEKMQTKYARDRKAARRHHRVTVICFLMVLAAIVCSALLVIRMGNQLTDIKEAIEKSGEVKVSEEEGATAGPGEYTFKLAVNVENYEDNEIAAAFDLGKYGQQVQVITSVAEKKKEEQISVRYILDEDESLADLVLVYTQDKSDNLSIGVKCSTDWSGFADREFICQWQYRSDKDTWVTIEESMIRKKNNGYSYFDCSPEWLEEVCVFRKPVELQCVIQIGNETGESMVITVHGIRISPEGRIVTND